MANAGILADATRNTDWPDVTPVIVTSPVSVIGPRVSLMGSIPGVKLISLGLIGSMPGGEADHLGAGLGIGVGDRLAQRDQPVGWVNDVLARVHNQAGTSVNSVAPMSTAVPTTLGKPGPRWS